jgi:hypothetical protein
MLQSA